jgi:hypothetical protein
VANKGVTGRYFCASAQDGTGETRLEIERVAGQGVRAEAASRATLRKWRSESTITIHFNPHEERGKLAGRTKKNPCTEVEFERRKVRGRTSERTEEENSQRGTHPLRETEAQRDGPPKILRRRGHPPRLHTRNPAQNHRKRPVCPRVSIPRPRRWR